MGQKSLERCGRDERTRARVRAAIVLDITLPYVGGLTAHAPGEHRATTPALEIFFEIVLDGFLTRSFALSSVFATAEPKFVDAHAISDEAKREGATEDLMNATADRISSREENRGV